MAEAAPEGEEVEAPPRGVFVYPNGEDKYDGEWAERVYGEVHEKDVHFQDLFTKPHTKSYAVDCLQNLRSNDTEIQ